MLQAFLNLNEYRIRIKTQNCEVVQVTKDNCTMQMYTAQITVAPNVLERTSS
jgi:hypothetical protein